MSTSTFSRTMKTLGLQGLEISGSDLVHGCEMLLSGVGVEANLDKGVRILKSSRRVADLGPSFKNSETNCQRWRGCHWQSNKLEL